jgi:hypothetical protein
MKRGRDSDYDDDDDDRQTPEEVEKKKETKKKQSDALRIGIITDKVKEVTPDEIVKIIDRHLKSFTAPTNLETKSFRFDFHSEWKTGAELAEAITAGPGGQFDFFIVDETDWMHVPVSERQLPKDMGTSRWIASASSRRQACARASSVIRGTKKWGDRYCATGPVVYYDPFDIAHGPPGRPALVSPPNTGWERFLIMHSTRIGVINGHSPSTYRGPAIGLVYISYSGEYAFSGYGEEAIRTASERAFVKQLVDIHPEIPRQTGEAMKKAFATKPLSVIKTVPEKDPDNPAKRRLIDKEMSQFPEALEDEMASFLGKFGKSTMRVQGGFKCPI